jgi:hypothetical protein
MGPGCTVSASVMLASSIKTVSLSDLYASMSLLSGVSRDLEGNVCYPLESRRQITLILLVAIGSNRPAAVGGLIR